MEHTKHIWRAILLMLILGASGIVGRHFLIPASFGAEGFYRYDSVSEHMAKPLLYGPPDGCRACHLPEVEAAGKGKHASHSCEGCHAPLSVHVTDNAKIADMPVDQSNALCLNCHLNLEGRPKEFPQIEPAEHLLKNGAISEGEPIPENACITCHDAHSPGIS